MLFNKISGQKIYLLILLCLPILAQSQTKGHPDVVRHAESGFVNWTTMTVYAEVNRAFDPHAPNSPQERPRVEKQSYERGLGELLAITCRLPVDGTSAFGDLPEDGFTSRYFSDLIPARARFWLPPHCAEGRFKLGLELPLKGELLAKLTNHYPLFESLPSPRAQTRASYHHSGVVIDARHLKFNPGLGTRIFNASGELIYGINQTYRRVFSEDSHILYLVNLDDPRMTERAGERFLLTMAKETRGSGNNDLVLFDRESDRILASEITRENLRRCRVVVLCRGD